MCLQGVMGIEVTLYNLQAWKVMVGAFCTCMVLVPPVVLAKNGVLAKSV